MIKNLLFIEKIANIYKSAFTLAEVLIVLGIIGVVAEMTIPTLMHNVQDQVFKVSYKKAFSVASQALMLANNDDLMTARPSWADETTNRANFNALRQQFKVARTCDTDVSQCWDMSGEKAYGIPSSTNTPGFVDNSGFVWIATNESGGFTGGVVVDTNGLKKPNKYGKDRFLISIYSADDGTGMPYKVVPWFGTGCDSATGDCITTSGCCPSGKCYYTSWLTN